MNTFSDESTTGVNEPTSAEGAEYSYCTDSALTDQSKVVRVVVGANAKVVKAIVDPLAVEKKARVKAMNVALRAGYSEPSASTR